MNEEEDENKVEFKIKLNGEPITSLEDKSHNEKKTMKPNIKEISLDVHLTKTTGHVVKGFNLDNSMLASHKRGNQNSSERQIKVEEQSDKLLKQQKQHQQPQQEQ